MHRGALALALAATSVMVGGCELFKTTDSENATGRGPKAFDPYAGAASGAIRLGLASVNGCGVLATGEPVGKGGANIPYPSACPRLEYQSPIAPVTPAPPMPLEAGATYFLNQITLEDLVAGLHTDPNNMTAVATWMSTMTRFAPLDWTNFGIIKDEWSPSEESQGPNIWDHNVYFGNANWQTAVGDTFLVEVLDIDGNVKQSITYDHTDFLAENPVAGHTQLVWSNANLGVPQYPGDVNDHPAPNDGVNYPPAAATAFRTRVRIDMILSTHPTKSFKLDPGLFGDGAIRLTWSQMPLDPFYFPVTFVKPTDIPPTCFSAKDRTTAVPCDFGLEPEVTMVPPKNGKYYLPGEQLQLQFAIKDGSGNYLHPIDSFPSYDDMYSGNANGLLYLTFAPLLDFGERDIIMGWNVSGPHQLMRPQYEIGSQEFFISGFDYLHTDIAGANAVEGARSVPLPTHQVVTLPDDAQPGTYSVVFKTHRQFLGERFTKAAHFDFQVGQSEPTQFPGRIGNCQICHRGVISLDNVRHGFPVDFVEGCKTCHTPNDALISRIASQVVIHQVHMSSPKYPELKNNCTMCHLTRESTLRPSYIVCSACHPQPHGTAFWQVPFQSDYDPANRGPWTNCAQQCHGNTPPTAHILPAQ
jgi:hypothetical protein